MTAACTRCGHADGDAVPCPACGLDRNIGRRIGDRFVIEEALGAGGMGSIYRGRDERLGEAVAIKLLKRTLLQDGVLRERFRREALALAKLRRPGIVGVLDFGDADGGPYTVLELVRGRTLEELALRGSALPLARAAPIFDQMLGALEVCHDSGVVHRDIKPSNVMVSTDGGGDHVTLIDFGLARVPQTGGADKLTETGVVHGTPLYMSPEQCRGEEVGPETDVYSAGIVLYELLAGDAPFQGSDAATFMAQHLFVDPQPLRQVAPHVPAGLAAAVHSALAKRPEDRPSVRALRAAIASAFRGGDPQTVAEAAAVERRRMSGLGRSERALATNPRGTDAPATSAGENAGNVIVWMAASDRAAALRGCLGAAGLSCSLWTRSDLPDVSDEDVAIVLSARDDPARIRRLRKAAPKLPIVVVDVRGPADTTAAIRAGASDMLLVEAPDADLPSKLRRLMRRRG